MSLKHRLSLACLVLLTAIFLLPNATPERPPVWRKPVFHAKLAFVGDVMMHLPILNSVPRTDDGTYDFSPIFQSIATIVRKVDYAVANLETRLASGWKLTGYPRFNSPPELAVALKECGFDLMATANNHCLDTKLEGLLSTLDNLDSAGLAHIGTHRDLEGMVTPFITEVEGIRIAWLNYTMQTNGLSLPPGSGWALSRLDTAQIAREALLARLRGADLIIALLHFGAEYVRVPDVEERAIAAFLCAHEVDAIIGAHPHVIQEIEWYPGTRRGQECPVAFSLGNFLANPHHPRSDAGLLLTMEVQKDSLRTVIRSLSYLPVYIQKGRSGEEEAFRLLPLYRGVAPESDLPWTRADSVRVEQIWGEMGQMNAEFRMQNAE